MKLTAISTSLIAVAIFLASVGSSYAQQRPSFPDMFTGTPGATFNLEPEFAEVYYNRGLTQHRQEYSLTRQQQYRQGLQMRRLALRQLGQLESFSSNESDYIRGLQMRRLALRQLEQLETFPSNESAYIQGLQIRGLANWQLGELQEAVASFSQILKMEPNALAYDYRGLARLELGDKWGAVADFTQALKLKPNLGEAYCHRGFTDKLLGNNQAALADWQKAAALFRQQNRMEDYQYTLTQIESIQGISALNSEQLTLRHGDN